MAFAIGTSHGHGSDEQPDQRTMLNICVDRIATATGHLFGKPTVGTCCVLMVLVAITVNTPPTLAQQQQLGPSFPRPTVARRSAVQPRSPNPPSRYQTIPYQAQGTLRAERVAPNRSRNSTRLTSAVRDAEKPLPPQILATPTISDEQEVIQHRSQLMMTRTNVSRIAIADSGIIDVVQYSPNELSIIGLELGSTTLTLWFQGIREPLIYLVTVIKDPSLEEQKRIDYGKLERKLAVLFPNSKVYLIPLSGKIVVKGQARDPQEAARILQIVRGEVINQEGSLAGPQPGSETGSSNGIGSQGFVGLLDQGSGYIVNMLEVPGEYQVMLKVRIAELNREQARRMGVDLNFLIDGGKHLVSSSMGGLPSTLTGIFESGEISVLLNWLASNGTAKILSSPTITVLSGHTASFLAGGEFAVPTIVGIGGAQGQTTQFRGFGTSLIATPTVIDRDLIRLQIVPEFSQINQGNAVGGIPGLDSRRVQTTVELREGQTLVLAGLYARLTRTEVTRIPFLGSIPWIGPVLFNAKRATEDETELIILVTPEIVRPMDPDEVPPLPGFEVTHPHDHELYRYAMTEGAPDTQVYQLAPFGRGVGHGIGVGYSVYEPPPASPMYAPAPLPNRGTAYGQQTRPPVGAWPQQGGYPPQGYGQQPGVTPRLANPAVQGAVPLPTGVDPSATNSPNYYGEQPAKSRRWSLRSLWPKAAQKIRQAGYDRPSADRQFSAPPQNFPSRGTAPRRAYR